MTDHEQLTVLAGCPLGDGLIVGRLRTSERLDAPYAVIADVEVQGGPPDLSAVLGADANVVLARGPHQRRFVGVTTAVRHLDSHLDRIDTHVIQLEIRPALHLLSMRRDTRMFQEKTAPEILETVLSEGLAPYGRSVRLELQAEYARREYCVQYRESDLDFVHRLLEEEGIAYSFEHDGEVEELVLRDANASYTRADGCDEPVPFEPAGRLLRGFEPVNEFQHVHRLRTTKVALRDWDFTRGGTHVEAERGGEDARGQTRESYEHGWGRSVSIWDHAGARYGADDAVHRVKMRLEAHEREMLVGRGTCRVLGFRPGTTFALSGHPSPEMNGEYLLTRVERDHGSEMVSGEPVARFECIPLDVPYRPVRRTPKPTIESVQTAVVTGPAGEEIHTDVHGRIKVQFHWDRENPADDTSSCWMRVQQKWAGAGWGFWWLPRIGMEVVVHFIDGDPDRPLVTGSVYNASNPLPYALPDEKTKSTIKSNSSPGGGGYNELRFEDLAGAEQIFTHAQKDYNEVVEHDHTTLVHNDQTIEVDGHQTQTVHANQTERVDADQELSVGGNRSVHVETDFDETVDGTETRNVTGDVTETFLSNETRVIAGDVVEDIGADERRDVGGNQTETIGGARTQLVAAASSLSVAGSVTETVGGGVSITAGGPWNVTATGGYTVVASAGFTLNAPGGLQIGAPGGVQQVDLFREILANTIGSKGVIQRGIAGVKRGVTVANYTLIGRAGGGDGCHYQLGMHIQNEGGIIEQKGAHVQAGAADVGAGPSSDD